MKANSLIFSSMLLWLAQAQALTLPVQPVMPYDCRDCESLPHEDLNSAWYTEDKPLSEGVIHKQISRKYQIKATLKELSTGVAIYTQASGAVIRIAATNPAAKIKPDFYIKKPQGANLGLKQASVLFSSDEALNNTAFAGESVVLKLKPELGSGKFIINIPSTQLKQDNELFIIHVYDKEAPAFLAVETDRARYHYGDELKVNISLHDDALSYPIDYINASLLSPEGEVTPLTLEQVHDNLYQASINLTSNKNGAGENWYVIVDASTLVDTQVIKRQAHTAFSYVIPSASLLKVSRQGKEPFSFSADLEVATGSRYALEAVLFGSDSGGNIHPIETVQSASWLPAGTHHLNFSFDSDLKTDYKAPYYLGYLHLIDFGQLKPVYEYNTPIELTALD
ncbi:MULTISPECIES: DUF4785 domain-containing protein [unclassified Legionella]|uniref:DUF4785 domain-containing protein n=1 Tax=unclassified Legionella TaxID=2622702 RepID=UPI001055F58C|nr:MULTISPECIES: DUF4785 domain-containing protein [unclassified Legionella]MDI9818567.1 DUF4785 family protein [Legionella sp. PL877]